MKTLEYHYQDFNSEDCECASMEVDSFALIHMYLHVLFRRGKLNSQFIVTARMDFLVLSKIFRFQMQI